ncbi:uncharacterized protein LOC141690742 [Apium graveolens]|uniref:uncharacterized protein LOC141690742 n=1 Tax=Apium graveolens TaxID=4045 RepID=UPI003D7A9AEF
MASSTMVPKFVKYITTDDYKSNEMLLPKKFVIYHGDKLSQEWNLSIRNGYKLGVNFDSTNYKINGVRDLFTDYGLTGGEKLIFENVDGGNFNVFIIGLDGAEIEYPQILHVTQSESTVTLYNEGWRFLKYVTAMENNNDEIIPPTSFMARFGVELSGFVTYVLNNGVEFGGFLMRKTVCFVDGRDVEIMFDNSVIASGNLRFTLRSPSYFAIKVQQFHMSRHSHGVDISVDFNNLTLFLKKREEIKVFLGDRCWLLEVRKRREGNRTAILGGWIQFRDDLKLNVGDQCVFIWIDESYNRFRIELVRALIEID